MIEQFKQRYDNDPNSKAFAPLCEAYRKAGQHDEAIKILKKSIKKHPKYVFGLIVLARCYVDLSNEQEAYDLLRPIVDDNIENIALQRLFAEICNKLVREKEELESLKRVLFYRPSDNEIFHRIKEIENEASPLISKKFNDDVDSWEPLNSIDFGLIDEELSKDSKEEQEPLKNNFGDTGSEDLMSYFDSKVTNSAPDEDLPMESFLMEKTLEKVTHSDDVLDHMIEAADQFIDKLIGIGQKNKDFDVVA